MCVSTEVVTTGANKVSDGYVVIKMMVAETEGGAADGVQTPKHESDCRTNRGLEEKFKARAEG